MSTSRRTLQNKISSDVMRASDPHIQKSIQSALRPPSHYVSRSSSCD
ncbi:hypothetical protein CEV34_5036 [Brucella pseudogrignonensis]|uniref:Uncharacterized protein n=1 Tax=Brucella pseudogrignonensis TaxID=419475 RepID=A0A256G2D6_9HYPH|nr:hypothetical protein CEV34_5036 [Brucella pseudogrignonensis]